MEESYLSLIRRVIATGAVCENRTGIPTKSLVGEVLRYPLQRDDGEKILPVFTTRKIPWRSAIKEMLWMISGDTSSKTLEDQGVKIWKNNSTRKFLDQRGLFEYPEGELGPVYGFQWRHFGADYPITAEGRTGVDQLEEVIRLLKEEPTSRRILMSAWNPLDLTRMALPPCHFLCQFLVRGKNLSCLLYQRSADLGLGVPFDAIGYAVLTHLLAHLTGLQAYELIHFMGDTHVYLDQIEGLEEQLTRTPFPFPTLTLRGRPYTSIDDFRYEDFTVTNYQSHPAIHLPMAI